METVLSLDSIDQFLAFMCVNGSSQNTLRAYRSDLMDLLTTLRNADPTHLVGMRFSVPIATLEAQAAAWLTAGRKKWAPKTTGRKSTTVRAWARWAGQPEFLANYRLPDPGKPQPHPIPEGMEGIAAMMAAAGNDCYKQALVCLVGMMGLRISEALSVTVESFDFLEKTVTVRCKGDKTKVQPVPARCWPHLAVAIAGARRRGPGSRLVEWNDRWARQVWTKLGVQAGLSRSTSTHDGRATFATHVYRVTKDLRAVQELLGHANAKTTQVYTDVNMADMRAAVEAAI